MRIVPILTAIIVSVGLYFLIFERDTLLSFARDTPLAEADAPEAETVMEEVAEAEVTPEDDGDGVRVVAM